MHTYTARQALGTRGHRGGQDGHGPVLGELGACDHVNNRGLARRSREGYLEEMACTWNEEEVARWLGSNEVCAHDGVGGMRGKASTLRTPPASTASLDFTERAGMSHGSISDKWRSVCIWKSSFKKPGHIGVGKLLESPLSR